MPTVLNKYKSGMPEEAVYVGRPTKWGNPFSHLGKTLAKYRCRTREEAIEKFAEYIKHQPRLLKDLHELKGKDLVCWCAPKRCHAEILMELANKNEEVKNDHANKI